MARMLGKSPDVHFCCKVCWPEWGDSPNRKRKLKYKRHVKNRERQQVRNEIQKEVQDDTP